MRILSEATSTWSNWVTETHATILGLNANNHCRYLSAEPETKTLVGEWEENSNEFQRMLFVRSCRLDRLSFCITSFIIHNLGRKFVEPPVLDIKEVLDISVAQSPLIFVLSPGVDPTNALMQLVENQNMRGRFMSLSLGQGQAPIATRLTHYSFLYSLSRNHALSPSQRSHDKPCFSFSSFTTF